MKKPLVLLSVIIVGASTAVVYYLFENALAGSIAKIWDNWLNTDDNRYLVIPVTIIIGLIFFGLQHLLDKKAEKNNKQALSDQPESTIANFAKVLIIGYFSLLAGASLGPEAILVPASMIIGGLMGKYAFNKDQKLSKLLGGAGLIALFTAFFNSIIIGVLSVFILTKHTKQKLSINLVIIAIAASISSWLTLRLFTEESYFRFPHHTWHFSAMTLVFALILMFAGYLSVYLMVRLSRIFKNVKKFVSDKPWWINGLVASVGLAVIFLLGGSLIEFTGNKSIVPMLNQAESLGLIGLIWLTIMKISAVSWSKAMGYRGGLIFPTFFIAAVFVAMLQLYVDVNFGYGLIAVLIGAFIANRKNDFLF